MDRPPSVRHGYYFALAAETSSFKANPLSADLFSTVPAAGGKGALPAALLPSSSADACFAHVLGLAEGARLESLNKVDDI